MSLERRLIIPILLGLLTSLLIGAALSYTHAVTKIRIELEAALIVAQKVAQHAVRDSAAQPDPMRMLKTIVVDFDGDRHITAILRAPNGTIIARSTPLPPLHPAPAAVFDLVSGQRTQADIALPNALQATAQLRIQTDAQNEVAEAWSDLQLALSVMAVFFCLLLALTVHTLRRSLRPLHDLSAAFEQIGSGNYSEHLDWPKYRELEPVQRGFNSMASRLAEMDLQNRLLATRMHCLQEDERAELARDLHDDVAPFLFAVSADAALIRQLTATGQIEVIEARAAGILESVAHMQKHIREILSRLMPDILLDLGLAGAVESLVHFWQARKPQIAFTLNVTEVKFDQKTTAVAFRVVQESLSNAIKHAQASQIHISIQTALNGLQIEVTDNGSGLPAKSTPPGLGLLSMRERVRSLGGQFHIANRQSTSGVAVRALLADQTIAALP